MYAVASLDYEKTFRAPSLKSLKELHWLDEEQRCQLRAAMKRPIEFRLGHHRSHAVHERMKELDAIAGTFGVEGFTTHRGNDYEYLNTGETYAPTIMANCKGSFFISSWGDIVESQGAD